MVLKLIVFLAINLSKGLQNLLKKKMVKFSTLQRLPTDKYNSNHRNKNYRNHSNKYKHSVKLKRNEHRLSVSSNRIIFNNNKIYKIIEDEVFEETIGVQLIIIIHF